MVWSGAYRRNKDFILFLRQALELYDRIIDWQKEMDLPSVFFVGTNKIDSSAFFADQIFDCLFRAYRSENFPTHSDKWNIALSCDVSVSSRIISLDKKYLLLDFQKMNVNQETEKLEGFWDELEKDFIDSELKKILRKRLLAFLDDRKKIQNCSTPFLKITEIERYLREYYDLLNFFLQNDGLLASCNTAAVINRQLEILDLNNDFSEVSILSPMGLNVLRKTYMMAEKYYRRHLNLKTGSGGTNEWLSLFDKNIVEKKVQHAFRWFMQLDGKIYHVAISPYIDDEESKQELKLSIPCRPLEDYNSYEGICELRVAEKILYEMGNRNDGEKEYKVALLGDINEAPVKELINYVADIYQKWDNENKCELDFDIYSLNFAEDADKRENNISYHLKKSLNEVFTNSHEFGKIIESHNVVFLLDCVKLYNPISAEKDYNVGFLKGVIDNASPFDLLIKRQNDICEKNMLDYLYEKMLVYNWKGYFGNLKKSANDDVLKFCETTVNDRDTKNGRHVVYAYVSDIPAFYNVYCNGRYFIRTERYNQKKIGVIRYMGNAQSIEELPVGKKDEEPYIICLNVWQVIKHICLERRKQVADMLKNSNLSLAELHRLYIGIDYTDWPQKLDIYSEVDLKSADSQEASRVKEFTDHFIEMVILPLINMEPDDLFAPYYWRAIHSILYGDAKNVRDMLLNHLMHFNKTGVAELGTNSERVKEKTVLENVNRNYKYSIKHFYEEIMDAYDISADGSYDQKRTFYDISSESAITDKKSLFKNVRAACDSMNYKDSYLYRNCENYC